MSGVGRIILPYRIVLGSFRLLSNAHYRVHKKTLFVENLLKFSQTSVEIMAQRSITSFFNKTPNKSVKNNDQDFSKEKSSKRERLESSGSECNISNKSSPDTSPVKKDKKKKVKRQRIESSSSELSQSPKKSITDEGSPIKLEKRSSHFTYDSPKSRKSCTLEKTPLIEINGDQKNTKQQSKSPKIKDKNTTPIKKEATELNDSREEEVKNKKVLKPFFITAVKQETPDVKKESDDSEELLPVPEVDYNPAKSNYDAVRDACWARGQEVPYLALTRTLEVIEGTSARLKMIEILSNYFRSVIELTPKDLLPSVYMCLNQLAPAYHNIELGIAETYLMKAIGQCTGQTLAQVKAAAQKAGDLGLVAEEARAKQRTMFSQPPLKARKVFATLKEIANMTGAASVNKKINKIQSLFVACRHSEARYLIRSLAGKLRIGLAEQSALAALGLAAAHPRGAGGVAPRGSVSPDQFKARVDEYTLMIKTTYCECPNYSEIIPALLEHGVESLGERCPLRPGAPLRPMLAHPTRGLSALFTRFEGVKFTCEWKYDGERAQIHVPEGNGGPDLERASIFSRNQENNTSKYPDVVRRLGALLGDGVTSCVLDCEAVAYDVDNKKILPFQVLSTRKRKDAHEADIKVQVCVFLFDLLFLNGRPLVREPLSVRRAALRQHFRQLEGQWQFATSKDCSTMEEVQQFLDESVKGSCEGLMVKTLEGPHATYEIARRSHNWLKLKKDYIDGVGDSLDLVVIGGYLGKGKRTGVFGGYLLACYEPSAELFQSTCKLGTGFSDAQLQELSAELSQHVIDCPPSYYRFDASHAADVWFAPAAVWEVRCADLSLSACHAAAAGLVAPAKGVSLRFPRFVRVRPDKSPEQATSAQQVADLYLAQQVAQGPADQLDHFY